MANPKGSTESLVQCRIEACQTIDEIVEKDEVSIRQACRMLAGESGVPFDTLRRWYYLDEKSSGVRVDTSQVPQNTQETKSKVAKKIVENINKALDNEEENAMSTPQGQAAKELANDLGGAVLAEELYDLFLKKIDEVSKVITANKELTEPMNADAVVTQLLRLARNAGWAEPVVEEPEIPKPYWGCGKCKVTVKSCPDRTCTNYVEKKKKKVKGKLKAKGGK
jgi:hypothetical protein